MNLCLYRSLLNNISVVLENMFNAHRFMITFIHCCLFYLSPLYTGHENIQAEEVEGGGRELVGRAMRRAS